MERTLGSLRAIDAVAPPDAQVAHPSAPPVGPPPGLFGPQAPAPVA
ncbi:MAG: hypothetical protein K0S40_4371, partial [Actinomycetospora sp.]|nr:hypothetical protein [Actinomycetospora sp.]